jgi:hypothetical protein
MFNNLKIWFHQGIRLVPMLLICWQAKRELEHVKLKHFNPYSV